MDEADQDIEDVEIEADETPKQKKPSKRKMEKKRIWTDDEVSHLIELWAGEEILYNVKHKLYFNKQERQKSLARVKTNLLDNFDTDVTEKDINEKMTALRTYYGAERRKAKSGDGADDVYVSRWRHFTALEFLSDSIVPRSTYSNMGNNEDALFSNSTFTPSSKVRRNHSKQPNPAQKLMERALSSLDDIQTRNEKDKENEGKERSEDDLLCEMLHQMLKNIPESQEKAIFRLELQQKVIMFRYKSNYNYLTAPTTQPLNVAHNSFSTPVTSNISQLNVEQTNMTNNQMLATPSNSFNRQLLPQVINTPLSPTFDSRYYMTNPSNIDQERNPRRNSNPLSKLSENFSNF